MNKIAMISWLIDSNNANKDIVSATEFVSHLSKIARIRQIEEHEGKLVLSFADYNEMCDLWDAIFHEEFIEQSYQETFSGEFFFYEDPIVMELVENGSIELLKQLFKL